MDERASWHTRRRRPVALPPPDPAATARLGALWPFATAAFPHLHGPARAVVDADADVQPPAPSPLVQANARIVLAALEAFHAETWGGRPRRSLLFHVPNPLRDVRMLRQRMRLALREARAQPTGEPVHLSLRADGPAAFVRLTRFLRERRGFAGLRTSRGWDTEGPSARPSEALFASALSSVALEGRPFCLEVALPLGPLAGADVTTRVAACRRLLALGAGTDLEVEPELGWHGAPAGLWAWPAIAPAIRATLTPERAVPASVLRWLGPEACAHPGAQWSVSGSACQTLHLCCLACFRPAAATIPLHQANGAPYARARARTDDAQYCALERLRVAMEGGDPDTVPDTIDALRERDGERSMDPADHAIVPLPPAPAVGRASPEGALTGPRRKSALARLMSR